MTSKAVTRKGHEGAAKTGAELELNHVLIYSDDVPRALAFYRDLLGFRLIEEMEGYARLRAPKGSCTIGLHTTAGERERRAIDTRLEGLRLYFEVETLDELCASLEAKGVKFSQPPVDMPWGWRHAYLRDPDGRELSLYRAGKKRFEKSPPM